MQPSFLSAASPKGGKEHKFHSEKKGQNCPRHLLVFVSATIEGLVFTIVPPAPEQNLLFKIWGWVGCAFSNRSASDMLSLQHSNTLGNDSTSSNFRLSKPQVQAEWIIVIQLSVEQLTLGSYLDMVWLLYGFPAVTNSEGRKVWVLWVLLDNPRLSS